MSRAFLTFTTVLGLACALSACSVQQDAAAVAFEEVFYEKTLCFGPCPAFIFHVQPNGQCEMTITRPFREGPLEQLKTGSYAAAMLLSASDWNGQIKSAIDKTAYLELRELYDNPRITDLPSTKTTLYGKLVTNRYKGPELSTLYGVFDEAMASLDWQPITNTQRK